MTKSSRRRDSCYFFINLEALLHDLFYSIVFIKSPRKAGHCRLAFSPAHGWFPIDKTHLEQYRDRSIVSRRRRNLQPNTCTRARSKLEASKRQCSNNKDDLNTSRTFHFLASSGTSLAFFHLRLTHWVSYPLSVFHYKDPIHTT